jgi:phosphatidylinositol-3,4,5-trisphosphate 3-phosphatase/dual-specificity protein phosphatase PTEN
MHLRSAGWLAVQADRTDRDVSGREAFREIDADSSGSVELEELLLWWFKDSVAPGHQPSWEKLDASVTPVAGAETDDGVMAHAREMFRKYDTDGGGEIDATEFTALCYDMGFFFKDEQEKLLVLSLLDSDGSNTISFREFQVWWKANKDNFFVPSYSQGVKSAIYYFKKFDTDMSGQLDVEEFRAMCKEMKWADKDVEGSLKLLDSDGNGEISFNEFLTWYTDDGMVMNLLKTYDKNQDSLLSAKEFATLCKDVWGLDKKKSAAILKKFDLDGDGQMGLADLRGMLTQVGNTKMASTSRSTQETADDFMNESSEDEDATPLDAVVMPRSMLAAAQSEDQSVSREMKKVLANESKKQINVRALVSKKKRRYTDDGFDLDLTYITDRVIALGFPSEGREAMYRNKMKDVQRFFRSRHKGTFKIYNLCSERTYSASKFTSSTGGEGQAVHYPFEDHNAPALQQLMDICTDMHAFLQADERNVVAVHCKAGKGRTGTVIASYMLYAKEFDTADDALGYFGVCRTVNGKGVTIPSQIRYVNYFGQVVSAMGAAVPEPPVVVLTKIRMYTVPDFDPTGGCDPYFVVLKSNGGSFKKAQKVYDMKKSSKVPHYKDLDHVDLVPKGGALPVVGDIYICLYDADVGSKDDKMCSLWFNTAFIETGKSWLMEKPNIDKANKNKTNFVPEFKLELFFEAS